MGEVFRQELTIADPEVLSVLGERTGMRFGYSSTDPDFSYRLARAGDERFALSAVHVGGAMSLWGDTETFTVAQVQGARYDWQIGAQTGSAAAGASVLFRPEHPSLSVIEDADVTLTHLSVGLVQEIADTVYGTSTPVAFDSPTPAGSRWGRYWSGLARYGAGVVASDAYAEPLVRAELTRFLAVGLLECFPLAGDREVRYLSMEAQVRRYRVAVQFFDDHGQAPGSGVAILRVRVRL